MSNSEILKLIEQKKEELKNVKGSKCEVWSRCVGFFRPTSSFNPGKLSEYEDRIMYDLQGEKK